MNSFYNRGLRMVWNNSLNKETLRFVILMVYLLSCYRITNGKEARIQRRFMWKQMNMEHLVNDMAARAYEMKNALSDLVPTINSVKPNKALDYLPSETTRIKYIIRNPTTNQPMKIIKMRPSKKIIKIIPKPTIGIESNPILMHSKAVRAYPSEDQMKKIEKEQELITEGRSSLKSENEIFNHILGIESKPILMHSKAVRTYPSEDQMKKIEKEQELITEGRSSLRSENEIFNHILGGDNYTEEPKHEIHVDEKHNSWLPVADTSQVSFSSSLKPKAVTSLHTNIMAEPLQGLEKQLPKKSIFSTNDNENEGDDDSAGQQKYYDNTVHTNTYEVTENVAEESVALPLIRDSQISLRIGTAPSRFAAIQTTNKIGTNREKNVVPISGSSSLEDPPNYPPNFLRRFRERSKSSAALPGITSTPITLRTQQQKNTADLNALWMHNANNITNSKETLKSRTRFQGMSSHIEDAKWPLYNANKILSSGNLGETKSVLFSSTTTPVPSVAEKQLSIIHKISQNADMRELREHNRGRIKFGDKIFTE